MPGRAVRMPRGTCVGGTDVCAVKENVFHSRCRPVGRGGSRGFARTPLFTSKIFYIHRLSVYFKCPIVLKWSTSLAAIENHHCPNESGCSYASLFVEN